VPGPLRIEAVTAADRWADVERLVRAYLAELPFEIDFQDLDRELAALDVEYGPPTGAAFVAVDELGEAVGVVGIRRFGDGEAELKRMYLDPAGRGRGGGRALAAAAVDGARALGYRRVLLDTVAWMDAAIATYESLGFVEIGPYRHNPLPDARYFARDL
jgi:GNAT superfamily N-acetyltransferase